MSILLFVLCFLAGVGLRRFFVLRKARKNYQEFHHSELEIMSSLEERREKGLASLENELRQAKQGLEKELRHKSQEQKQLENRIREKEKSLEDKKGRIKTLLEEADAKEKVLAEELKKRSEVERQCQELSEKEEHQLEALAGRSREEMKKELAEKVEAQVREETQAYRKNHHKEEDQKIVKEAQKILEMAIQRMELLPVGDGGVATVALPSDEMKGRIIGKEGRNIQTLEMLTGAEFILDQTPGVIVIQSVDAIRREIGRRALELLIQEGRINPVRIEEVVRKIKADIDDLIQEAGEETLLELKVHEVHPDLIRLLGRLKFAYSQGQNVLQHLKETAYFAEMMAAELGLPTELAKRAGLFHDIGKSIAKDVSAEHDLVGKEIAKRYGEDPVLIHAIEAHHGRVPFETPLAAIIAASNVLSGSRPAARSEKMQHHINRVEAIEKTANSFKGVERSYCVAGGREVRVFVDSKQVDEPGASELARQISKKLKENRDLSGEIKVVLIRETRIVEFTK